jgi:hypothetical protein
MPLRDHFHPPTTLRIPWEQFHGQWPSEIVRELNKTLPPRYRAAPTVHLGREAEIDIGMIESQSSLAADQTTDDNGGVAVAVWAPAEPTLAVETDLADFDEFEVRVYDTTLDERLVAAIELISPGNKDRPQSRSQFTSKCAALLRQGVSLALVDVITERSANLYADLLDLIGQWDKSLGATPPATYAAACRWTPHGKRGRWESWNREMRPGLPLPSLPVWLAEDTVLTLDLESSYEQTCRDLRIA